MENESRIFGGKAVGLMRLPVAWTPKYVCIASEEVKATRSEAARLSERIKLNLPSGPVILRSSAISETLADRGHFNSHRLNEITPDSLLEVLEDLFTQGQEAGIPMAVVAQSWLRPVMRGHLSNERRVSKTRNQWQVEVDYPCIGDFRLNSQRDPAPPISRPIALRHGDIRRTLGGVGNWAATTFESRVHMEWVYDNTSLWIVQLDLEDEAPDCGVDPRILAPAPVCPLISKGVRQSDLLRRWTPGMFSGFRKLEHAQAFSDVVGGNFPPLFVLQGSDAEAFLLGPDPAGVLFDMVGGRLVGRCDIRPEARSRYEGLNLPRTDTVTPAEILAFIRATLDILSRKGASTTDVVLIIHKFIPATSAAWAEAIPGRAIVQVDALWGLPDGLQYLDYDLFEYDTAANSLSAEHIPYKEAFLGENEDGTWSVHSVKRNIARTASISREDVAIIAKATLLLSERVNHPLRVMWFVGIHNQPGIASAIPWFCHKPELLKQFDPEGVSTLQVSDNDRSSRRRLPSVEIKGPEDLVEERETPHRLNLLPNASHMRDNDFLRDVALYAKSGDHVIELRGSGLAHAYYILKKEGVPIVVPSQRTHLRVRRLQTFGKLVRDGIPAKIEANREKVRFVTLPAEDRRRFLISKLLEEAHEVVESTNLDDLQSELADVLEVVRSLVRNADLDWNKVQNVADDKAKRLGSFDNGTVLLETTGAVPRAAHGRRRRTSVPMMPSRQGNVVTIPHMALIGDSVEIAIGSQDVRVTFGSDGLTIEELGPKTDDGQLRLDL